MQRVGRQEQQAQQPVLRRRGTVNIRDHMTGTRRLHGADALRPAYVSYAMRPPQVQLSQTPRPLSRFLLVLVLVLDALLSFLSFLDIERR